MVHFIKEITVLLGASLAIMWFPLWFCLFNMHFSVQCICCWWSEGIQSEKNSLAIMCCLLYQKVQSRYISNWIYMKHLDLTNNHKIIYRWLIARNAVTPLLAHWCYCSLALSHRYVTIFTKLASRASSVWHSGVVVYWLCLWKGIS